MIQPVGVCSTLVLNHSPSATQKASIELSNVASCSLCGSSQRIVVLRGPDRMHRLPGQFTLVQCMACKLVYQSPRPAEHAIDQLYPPAYEPFRSVVADDGYIPRDLRRTAEFVNSLAPGGGRLLDVGCGVGDFLVTIRRLFPAWHVSGVEPIHEAAAHARQRGLPVVTGTLDDVPDTGAPLSVITLWNVLEHLADPLAFLHAVKQRLAPDGILCLAVPVHDSWEARLFGKYWVGWELPRHFYIFDRTTLTHTLEAAGFTIMRRACISGTYYGIVRSSLLVVEEAIASFAMRRLCEHVLTSYTARLVFKPYIWLAEYLQRGTVLTVAARRAGA